MTDTEFEGAVELVDTPVPPVLAAALVEAWAELENLTKDKTANAGTYSYQYADLGDLVEMARPVLARHGLALIQPVMRRLGHPVEVETWLLHRSGHMLRWVFETPGEGSPQTIGSAITYIRRYCGQGALGVAPMDGDDDGKAAEEEAQRSKPAPKPPKPRKPTSTTKAAAADDERRRKHAMVLVGQLGLSDDRPARLALWSEILGREVSSFNDLQRVEQTRVIAEMQQRLDDHVVQADIYDADDTLDVELLAEARDG